MKEIKIIGEAAEVYGSDFWFNVKTPLEAISALDANFEGFLRYVTENDYVSILFNKEDPDKSVAITHENSMDLWGDEVLLIMPNVNGNPPLLIALPGILASAGLTGGIGGMVASTAGMVAATTTAGATILTAGGALLAAVVNIGVMVGLSMAVSVISGAIAGDSSSSYESAGGSTPSYIFNGVTNTTRQGARMPLFYGGPLLVGSMTISARVITEDAPI